MEVVVEVEVEVGQGRLRGRPISFLDLSAAQPISV